MKEKLIELFKKIGNETDTFAPFITCDEFEGLADEIVKLCNLHCVINWVAVYDRLPERGTFCITQDESDGYDLQYWKGYWETEYPVKENDVLYWAEVKPPCL